MLCSPSQAATSQEGRPLTGGVWEGSVCTVEGMPWLRNRLLLYFMIRVSPVERQPPTLPLCVEGARRAELEAGTEHITYNI